jgi:hypothetical protein
LAQNDALVGLIDPAVSKHINGKAEIATAVTVMPLFAD